MPNLDLSIVKIMHGDVPVLRIMEGDTKIWPSGTNVIVDGTLTNATSSVSLPATVALNGSFTTTLTANTSCILNQVEVIMGGVDVTSTAYNEGVITIASVTGDVVITASAIEVITFEDAAVKQICVENWGGGVIEGEITPTEAAAVTSLGAKFYGNTTIRKFNELSYFTGITGSGLYYQNSGSTVSTYRGQFAGCTNLEELTVPAIRTSQMNGLFYNCQKLKHIDLSQVTITASTNAQKRFSMCFARCNALQTIVMPRCGYAFYNAYQDFTNDTSLTSIDFTDCYFNGLSATPDPNPILGQCTALTDLPAGLPRLNISQNFKNNPLSHDSAVAVLQNLAKVTGKTITFKATTYATLTAEEIAIGTAKGWSIVSA